MGWFILWQHRQNKQIRPMKLRTARLVSRRAVLDAILLFGDKNLFPQVTDEFDRNRRRRVQLRRRKLSGPLAVVFRTSPGRFVMKGRILIAAAAALATASPIFVAAAHAADPSADTQPGFVPDTGQINPGHAAQPWSNAPALPQSQQPAQEDARAALMVPDNGAPSRRPRTAAASQAARALPMGRPRAPDRPGRSGPRSRPCRPNSRSETIYWITCR